MNDALKTAADRIVKEQLSRQDYHTLGHLASPAYYEDKQGAGVIRNLIDVFIERHVVADLYYKLTGFEEYLELLYDNLNNYFKACENYLSSGGYSGDLETSFLIVSKFVPIMEQSGLIVQFDMANRYHNWITKIMVPAADKILSKKWVVDNFKTWALYAKLLACKEMNGAFYHNTAEYNKIAVQVKKHWKFSTRYVPLITQNKGDLWVELLRVNGGMHYMYFSLAGFLKMCEVDPHIIEHLPNIKRSVETLYIYALNPSFYKPTWLSKIIQKILAPILPMPKEIKLLLPYGKAGAFFEAADAFFKVNEYKSFYVDYSPFNVPAEYWYSTLRRDMKNS